MNILNVSASRTHREAKDWVASHGTDPADPSSIRWSIDDFPDITSEELNLLGYDVMDCCLAGPDPVDKLVKALRAFVDDLFDDALSMPENDRQPEDWVAICCADPADPTSYNDWQPEDFPNLMMEELHLLINDVVDRGLADPDPIAKLVFAARSYIRQAILHDEPLLAEMQKIADDINNM